MKYKLSWGEFRDQESTQTKEFQKYSFAMQDDIDRTNYSSISFY